MSQSFYSKENLRFVLYEMCKAEQLCTQTFFAAHNKESFDMILDATHVLANQKLRPLLVEMDRYPPQLIGGKIKVHPALKKLMQEFGEGGWIGMSASYAAGGQQVPYTIFQACGYIMAAANYSTMVYPFLSNGAAHLIESFGSKTLQEQYIPKIFSGEWQGTMALTEPEAGSSLADIQTKAYRTTADYYLIKGQKVFISCGDHDACNNIVHLMLARIEGAPAGTKGISLFVVPQQRITETNELVFNDVNTAGIFHKMGYHGAPITHLMMGEKEDCRAWLIGEENKGLSYMFQMMNEARIGVGLNATAIASAAYYHSLNYARTRKQGRLVATKKTDTAPVEIIRHPDIKRLLLFQKAISEGALALAMQACMYFDLYKTSEGDEKKNYFLLLDLLTPIVKSYPAEMSIQTTSAGIQVLGGYGYTNEYLAELFFRETRIHTIHEGTTAIHGLDLLGRKITQENGKALQLLANEINQTIVSAKNTSAAKYADKLAEMLIQFNQLNQHLFSKTAAKGLDYLLADASLYLELAGIITIAWQWLKQAVVANELINTNQTQYNQQFLESKLATCNYFYEYECVKAGGLIQRLQSDDALTIQMDIDLFN